MSKDAPTVEELSDELGLALASAEFFRERTRKALEMKDKYRAALETEYEFHDKRCDIRMSLRALQLGEKLVPCNCQRNRGVDKSDPAL